jgi:hypothetical protein
MSPTFCSSRRKSLLFAADRDIVQPFAAHRRITLQAAAPCRLSPLITSRCRKLPLSAADRCVVPPTAAGRRLSRRIAA